MWKGWINLTMDLCGRDRINLTMGLCRRDRINLTMDLCERDELIWPWVFVGGTGLIWPWIYVGETELIWPWIYVAPAKSKIFGPWTWAPPIKVIGKTSAKNKVGPGDQEGECWVHFSMVTFLSHKTIFTLSNTINPSVRNKRWRSAILQAIH